MGNGSSFFGAGADRSVLQPPHRLAHRHTDSIQAASRAGKSGEQHRHARHPDRRCVGKPGDNPSAATAATCSASRVGAIFINKDSVDGARTSSAMVDANRAEREPADQQSPNADAGQAGDDMASTAALRIAIRSERVAELLDVQENFNAEAGFVQRTGIRTTKGYFSPTPRPKAGRVKLFEPMYVLTYTTDQANRLVYRNHHLMLGTTLRDDTFINVFYQKTLDVLDVPFRIRPDVLIPAGKYNMHEWYFTVNSSPGKRFYERVTVSPVQFYDGTRLNLSGAGGIRATSQFSAEVQYNRNDVRMPWGDFLVNLSVLRLDYTFTPRMTVRSLTQYNSLTTRCRATSAEFHLPAGSDITSSTTTVSDQFPPVFGKKATGW